MPQTLEALNDGKSLCCEEDRAPDAAAALRQIAHHLRQPLSTIEAIAYYLSITLPARETKALDQIEKMQSLVQEANFILCDAMHYFHASPPHPTRVDLDEVVAGAVAEVPPSEASTLRFTPCHHPVPVELDAAQTAHMVRNVLNYFRQISLDEDPVEIATSATEFEAEFRVRLAGAACSAAEIEPLLAPDSPHLGSGSGLAMASVRRIVDANGGRIGVTDQASGGILLTVTFPLATNR